MELISKFNKGIHFLLCVIDIFSKYPWLIPMKYKKRISIINVYIDKLDYIVNKYNNTNHRIIKRKSVNVKWSTYFDSSKEINDKDLKFEIDDFVRISKYKYVKTFSQKAIF